MRSCIKTLKKMINDTNTDDIDIKINNLLSAEMIKNLGAFFTERALAEKACRQFKQAITAKSVVLDPTCGIGNLLIESSRQLGVSSTLSETLSIWGSVLRGWDIQADFIEVTKLRLIIAALERGVRKDCSIEQALNYFKYIEQKDALTVVSTDVYSVTHLFMNPPFIAILAPKRDYWGNGKTNSAAVFFDYYLRILPNECNTVAILPDILRSGSRFNHFRDFVSENLLGKVQIWGRFANTADVDVFILSGIKQQVAGSVEWSSSLNWANCLATQYDVCIGPLVAYRDKQEGESYPYFHAKNCRNWETITAVSEMRAFSGKTIQPPCVLIKRTSSPSDKYRAAATLINLKQPIAVENHLIVVTAKDKTLKSCQRLLKMLAKDEVNQFLNEQIRARHLTVGVIKSIPLSF
ncbi:N-6 DNA methylase [Glaesserella parasuis]|uniref:N-6 DNA methylase n=1 Tax=Glaesserella parasuis TaxID=738 RepID=UPI00055882AD|nr:N-6 DNA methylase [Glaesserella parasuis]MDP0160436.1 N-6 DNA methylase [Glaesserella parasuis]MEE3696155.1 N-6 DNA methylase [Glaesserella parasuis]